MKQGLIEAIHGQFGRFVSGTPIWERDWGILCVLDACRADTFREFYPDADSYTSVASTSKYWLERTFGDRDLGNVGYVTGNPFAAELDADRFGYFHLEPVAEVAGVETVGPTALRDRAVTAWRECDLDRLIIHFMQPHVPFRSRPAWFDAFSGSDTWGSHRAWAVADGEIDREEWLAAYRDNLSWVLEEGVEPLAELVDATVGVTADHGNAHGEWGLYGHPSGCAIPAVREVPWWTFEARQVCDDFESVSLESAALTSAETEAQLAALGYL